MILIDPRAGSVDYVPRLRALGCPVDVTPLEFGDAAFTGSGKMIGVELKKLNDVLQCIVTGRFSGHQLPGLARDYDEAYLCVEGFWRPNPTDGVLETRRGAAWVPCGMGKKRWMYRDLDNFLLTTEIKGGVHVRRTATEDETARMLYDLYSWWQDYDGHRSHLALNHSNRDCAIFAPRTLSRRVAAELPGIGQEKSAMIAGHFTTVRQMVNAKAAEWLKLPGIGKKIAAGIVEAWDDEC